MIPTNVKRPRNVNAPRAAAILYGDWGTSKAYVIGLAFAVAGYSSFWLIAAMCVLTALVGLNYMIICRLYPDGGGVYASVRHRSEIISIVGAFLLIADYLVTAAISALSAFAYLGVPHPEKFAAAAILMIGLLNLLGPRHTGGLAFLISVPTLIVVVVLGLFSIPHIHEAIGHLQPLHGGFWSNWAGFVGIVLALSGVEAIANAAIVDLITIQFLMARDRELPNLFQRLNKWGVPSAGMLLATIVPMLLVIIVKDMSGLADLYAVGVVGAIATNLGATSTDRKLSIKTWERTLMFGTFLVMAAIEMSLLIDKPNARYFAVTILAVGLILRGLVLERRIKKAAAPALSPRQLGVDVAHPFSKAQVPSVGEAILCAVRSAGRTLDFALREAATAGARLYLLFVREQPFMTEEDARRKWQQDPEASAIFAEAKQKAQDITPLFCYAVSPSAAETIVA